MRQDETNAREWKDGRNWHGGPLGLYASRDDDRAFVPKRHPSLGVTPNLATRTGLGFMIGVVVFIAVILWAVWSVERRPAPVAPPPAGQVGR